MSHFGETARLAVCLLGISASASAQFATNVVVPQSRIVTASGSTSALRLVQISAEIDVVQRVAVTAISIDLENASSAQQEAELLLPVPDDAIVRSFDFTGKSQEPTAQLLPRGAAKATYDSLVSRARDPALLEFAGRATVRSSVFPIGPRDRCRVRLVYEHVLPADGDRVDYELPRSESLASGAPWRVEARIRSVRPIATVYSPSHSFAIERAAENVARLRLSGAASADPGSIQFSWLVAGDGVNGSFYVYPEPGTDGGYFLLLGGVPVTRDPEKERGRRREVIVVLDTSGSMAGKKIEQAKAAALQVLEGLDDGERFNVVPYDDTVSSFATVPVPKSDSMMAAARRYVEALGAKGGTNIDGALKLALSQEHDESALPILLFLTDGLPTVGEKSEVAIRDNAKAANRHGRRIFTFGVGDDVNAPLLDFLASSSRATSAYVRPEESVEKRVSEVFARLKGPILASPRIAVFDAAGEEAHARVFDVLPALLPDLYDGDELLLAGRFRGTEPLFLELSGDYLGAERSFRFRLAPDRASLAATFVPRIWASRRIGVLVDELRQQGALAVSAGAAAPASTPPHTELLDEVYRLSREFGVMTEYTAFLALEGTDLAADALNLDRLESAVRNRLQNVRSGRAAIAQSANTRNQAASQRVNRRNRLVDAAMNEIEIQGVAQIADRAFYRRGERWIDSRLPRSEDRKPPDEVVAFGSRRHDGIVLRLTAHGRQGVVALRGDVLLELDGKRVLLLGPRSSAPTPPSASAPTSSPAAAQNPLPPAPAAAPVAPAAAAAKN